MPEYLAYLAIERSRTMKKQERFLYLYLAISK